MKRIIGSRFNRSIVSAVALLMGLSLVGCGSSGTPAAGASSSAPAHVRLGFLPNITNAPALVGLSKGYFARHLASGSDVSAQSFNAGPAEVEAILGGAVDVGFLGPNPAINAHSKSHGDAIRVIAGASSGGASLVVRPAAQILAAADLRGKTIATPELGNTQDVALRAYLADKGFRTNPDGSGDVKVLAVENATALQLFRQGQVDGAWVPEPWASRLVLEAGGKRLVDERDLWPGGQFPSTVMVASRTFLAAHPDTVEALLQGEIDAIDYIASEPAAARDVVDAAIKKQTGKALQPGTRDAAWQFLSFTVDPLASGFRRDAENARRTGVVRKPLVDGIFDLRPLNRVRKARGLSAIASDGLGP